MTVHQRIPPEESRRLSARLPATVFSALGLALAALAVARSAPAQVACSDCHDVEPPPAAVHAPFACTDCHSGVEDYPHPEDMLRGDAVCAQCHGAGDELEGSVHGGVLSCQECHGEPHEILPIDDLDSRMSALNQPAVCGECHETEEGLIEGYLDSVHGRALLGAGLVRAAPSCTDCHGAHDVQPIVSEASQISHENVPATCGDCHQGVLQEWQASAHGELWEAGSEAGPVCTTCHASHEVDRPTLPGPRLASPGTCGNCHQESLETYRDSFHGQVTDLGFLTSATCADCHTPHANLPAGDPASSIHPDNLGVTCGQCHGDVSPAFLSFDPHAEPSNREKNPALFGVWLFMTSLLVGVFAFFGVHTLLWLQRALVALSRGELAHERSAGGGPWVRRFSLAQRRIHWVVIVTFLVLAATGLPLKFHHTGWAQALLSWPGGVALSRWLHRLAAILTFGYFFVHLGMVLRRALLKREPGIFYGWKSMMPRPKDFADLWNNLRYFLYLGPRPRFDRWTYWEKFDYFAVFWGVAIIGASGLMLWFPEAVTTLVPGWWLNAAFVVHSDEALLAVGFIFLFHFFHTHLRPESFPMDPVIFVGAMPLERFKAERPVEYRRLVERGELEGRLVPAPSAAEIRSARIRGLSAVAIGLILVAGIAWGFLGS